MKTALWTLLLMGLFVPGCSSCQSDCNYCELILNGIQGFDIAACTEECLSTGLNLEICQITLKKNYKTT